MSIYHAHTHANISSKSGLKDQQEKKPRNFSKRAGGTSHDPWLVYTLLQNDNSNACKRGDDM